jgi:hypothetical protein
LSYNCVNNDDIRKWPLVQIILNGYPLIQHLISFNETHIPNLDDVEAVGVRKEKNSFHKRKQNVVDFEVPFLKLKRCCQRNCCQHFLHEKNLFVEIRFLEFTI